MTLGVRAYLDPLLLGGLLGSATLGLLNPFYTTHILAHLNIQVLSVGSFLLSCLPFLVASLLGAEKWQIALLKRLPWILAIEFALTAASGVLLLRTLAGFYLANTAIYGLLNTIILCLMQRIKVQRYPGNKRAGYERRYLAADALGYGLGSGLVMLGIVKNLPIWGVFGLSLLQVAILEIACLLGFWEHSPA